MAAWEIRIGEDLYRDTALIIETPAGERTASIDPYESSAYNAPLDIVRGVTLSDLGRVLRPSIGCWQLEVSRDAEEWFDLETANIAITLRPAGRRFELEFTYLDGVQYAMRTMRRPAAGSLPTSPRLFGRSARRSYLSTSMRVPSCRPGRM
jgi:hypothetical protein